MCNRRDITGTFKVTLEVSDPRNDLRPGMFGRVAIAYEVHEDALLVPSDAVLAEDEQTTVFVVEDGVARKKAVETGLAADDRIEILSGLGDDEEVIVVGQLSINEGTRVESRIDGQTT